MNYESEINDIISDFASASGMYSELSKAYGNIVKWEYASSSMYTFIPFYSERNKLPTPKILPDDKISGYSIKHGIDSDGKVLVSAGADIFPGQFYETFYIHSRNSIRSYYFHYTTDKKIINIHDYIFNNGLLSRVLFCSKGENSITDYSYESGKLSEEIIYHPVKKDGVEIIESKRILYNYDACGLLSIRENDFYHFYRLTDDEFEEICRNVKFHLLESIKKILAEAVKEKVFAVALLYEQGFCFPPDVILGEYKKIRNNKALLTENEYRSHPSDWGNPLKYDYDEKMMNKLNNISESSSLRYSRLVRLISDMAFDLNTDVETLIPSEMRTDDFIVIHSDFDGYDIEENTRKMRQRLKSACK